MEIIFSEVFRKDYRKIRDEATRLRIIKSLKAVAQMPQKGKNLQNVLAGKLSLRIGPFRLIYEISGDSLHVLCFEHRQDVYKKMR